MNQPTAFITGANGAIGKALCSTFYHAGWRVIASDIASSISANPAVDVYLPADLKLVCQEDAYREHFFSLLREKLDRNGLHLLVNNAAVQTVLPMEELSAEDWHTTMDVNLIAPFLLTKALLPELRKSGGSIINIASIHAQLTKPHFTVYAASKAALIGMTRSLAVELGRHVRVNAICPAAIATPMLEEGFRDDPQGREQLDRFHPSGCIGTTKEVADAALYLAETDGAFLNGTIINLDGGVASRLHDPA